MLLSKCAVCNSRKSKFLKEQEAKGLLSKVACLKVVIVRHLPIANILL